MLFLNSLLVGIRDSTQINTKETPLRRTSGLKESIHFQSKESNRDSSKSFVAKNMSPPLTNFQTNTSSTTTSSSSSIAMSNQSNMSLPHHMPQHMYPQMYSPGSVPLIQQHYPIHAGFMPNASTGHPMIPSYGVQHGDRNESISRESNNMGMQNDHQSINSSQHLMNSSRGSRGRGRSRGAHNNMSRREYHMRQQQHQHQQNQSSAASSDYGLEQAQPTAVMSSGPYQQFYFHHYPPYYAAGPNVGASHLNTSATAQNLTGQPLFALQQPVQLIQYGSPYPIMYNMMPSQGHTMNNQPSDLTESEHNQSLESGGLPATVIQSIAWQHPVAYQEPHQQAIFEHSRHINAGESDLEFAPQDEYHIQLMNPDNYAMIAQEQVEDSMISGPGQQEQNLQNEYVEIDSIENGNEAETILVEKTRDLMIQTDIPPLSPSLHKIASFNECKKDQTTVPNSQHSATENFDTLSGPNTKIVDNRMIVKNKEKPPAWSSVVVPNMSSAKKQTASVSVSAIPNKDVAHLQSDFTFTSDGQSTSDVLEAAGPTISAEPTITPTLFSSIIASKSSSSLSPIVMVDKKVEIAEFDSQLQPKHHQMALSEHAKQQIVTTITGVGGAIHNEPIIPSENARIALARTPKDNEKGVLTPEKSVQSNKPAPSANSSSAQPRATWAGLFNSSESPTLPKVSHQTAVPPLSPPMQESYAETQKTTAKNPEPLFVHTTQVPGAMSYSAVSAQSLPASNVNYAATVTSIPLQMTTNVILDSKKLPQSKLNLSNVNNNNNHLKTAPLVDQHALKLGGSFSAPLYVNV